MFMRSMASRSFSRPAALSSAYLCSRHGFIDATSMNDAGYSVEYFALLILIILSSSGWRITSSTLRLNSGSSSKRKKWYHCSLSYGINKLIGTTYTPSSRWYELPTAVSTMRKEGAFSSLFSANFALSLFNEEAPASIRSSPPSLISIAPHWPFSK